MNLPPLCGLFLLPVVSGLAFLGPRATQAHQAFENEYLGWTPQPTSGPDASLLHRRASASGSLLGYLAPDNTCGYVGGSLGEWTWNANHRA